MSGAIVLLAAAFPAAASARATDALTHSKRLWATINVCDTIGHPDSIGIRGSMPGTGDRTQVMYMRFQAEYFTPTDARWHSLAAADSGFVEVGSAARTRQSGITFTITPPRAGAAPYLLRGLVTFEWRDGDDVVRRARKRTGVGHPNTAGADPASFSAATCSIT